MPDYSKGKIYSIRFYDNDKLIYIGSTTQILATRHKQHKCNMKTSLYQYIKDNYNEDFKCCYIKLLEYYECNNRNQLEKREGQLIRQFNADINYIVINKNTPINSYIEDYIKPNNFKEYNEYIKTKIKEWTEQYYLENEYSDDIIKIREKNKQYNIYIKANIDEWRKQFNQIKK